MLVTAIRMTPVPAFSGSSEIAPAPRSLPNFPLALSAIPCAIHPQAGPVPARRDPAEADLRTANPAQHKIHMKRREFLTTSAAAGAAAVCASQPTMGQARVTGGGNSLPGLTPPAKPAELNLCLQWHAIPGGETNQKLDFLEANGFSAVEIPSGDWPIKNCDEMNKAMTGRKLRVATACGPSDFSYAEPEKREAEVLKFLPIIEALGAMKSVGLIVCPARGKVPMGFAELRQDFVSNTGKRLAEHAAKHGTAIVLEPLRRNETPFLRQVADGARMAADIGPGAAVMGDFWHMGLEETSFMGAFICAGGLLRTAGRWSSSTRLAQVTAPISGGSCCLAG